MAIPAIIVAAIAGAVVVGVAVGASGRSSARTAGPPVAWTPVVRTNLVATVPVQGALAYQSDIGLTGELSGVAYTKLPALGQVIARGQEVAAVDDEPIYLFYGRVPEWRNLNEGVSEGPDVAQLNANLVALGYESESNDPDAYGWETAVAVERWQAAHGLLVTGGTSLGAILYAPGAMRVTALSVHLGSPAAPGAPLLQAGSPTPLVDIPLPVAQENLVHAGQPVTVTLPDGHTTAPGVVASVSPVATSAPGNGGQPTVAVTVRLGRRSRLAGALDQAPVTVSIVTGAVRHVLAVPVGALVALAGGGYAVNVQAPRGARLVSVRTGLFARGLVQVDGDLSHADYVEVPAS